jgi:transcriptional regulator of acetoin/glycerol metabolism
MNNKTKIIKAYYENTAIEASKILGISKTTLYKYLVKLGVEKKGKKGAGKGKTKINLFE